MKGYKEFGISFLVGIAALGTFFQVQSWMKSKDRSQAWPEPTVLQGRSEDPHLSLSWGLEAIAAPRAWRIQQGSKDIIVAVIDTGCDVHHPDLKQNIWINSGETGFDADGNPKRSNGLDDDHNGFVDDFHGWNFVADSPDVMDEHGHGTHIAGIIGAGSSGVAPRVSLMVLKYYDELTTGEENLSNTVAAIHYAVQMGAQIINYSGGGILRSDEERKAIAYAAARGVLFVAAAGNEGSNSDFFHFYPADYDLPNILSVAATDRLNRLLSVSNFGKTTVDVAAPGKNIHSTLPGGQYGYMTGTSQATAFVTGLAALLMAESADYREPSILISHLLQRGRRLTSLRGKTRSESLINAELALSGADRALFPKKVAVTTE